MKSNAQVGGWNLNRNTDSSSVLIGNKASMDASRCQNMS